MPNDLMSNNMVKSGQNVSVIRFENGQSYGLFILQSTSQKYSKV